jgi:hypothetical protein
MIEGDQDTLETEVAEGGASPAVSKVVPSTREELLAVLRTLYEVHGVEALSTPFLEKQRVYARLLAVGLYQADYLEALGLAEEYAAWRNRGRTYRGTFRPKWTWERVIEKAREVKDQFGDLPTMEWFRKNGRTSLVNGVFRSGHSWGDLREALGSFTKSTFRTSRSGMRWLSHPEASMSDFLYARGIEHKRGERYDQGYAEQSGRRHGTYDMHFLASDGGWIDVEIWGDLPDNLSGGRYADTRELKEAWNEGNLKFLGIQYQDCLSDETLTRILEPFIGVIEPFRFEKPQDPFIETSHWTDSDELLETCRQLAAAMPDGIFPNEQWLRKRGKFSNRPGPTYNVVALRVNQWLGGMRKARELLGQSAASTTAWTPERAIQAWREFQAKYGLSPTQLASRERKKDFPPEVVKNAQAIRQAAVRHGVIDEARDGKSARKIIWTEETVLAAWREFEAKHGCPPSKFVGTKRRLKYSKALGNEAARIYNVARKLGMLDVLIK